MPTVYTGPSAETLAQVVLDPSEVAVDRVELELNSAAIRVNPEGIDWGTAEIAAHMAEQRWGETPVDHRVPNRRVSLPLVVGAQEDGFAAAKANLQAKVALIQQEGGWFRRGDGMYADVVDATLTMPEGRFTHLNVEPETVLVLECLPDLYGDERVGAVADGDGELIFTEPIVDGDYPARVRIVVDDDSGVSQRGLIGGFRCRHYSPTAPLAYDATDLEPLDVASVVGGRVKHPDLATGWVGVVGTGFRTHTGSYRLWAQVETDSPDVQVRLVWDVGDLTRPVENTPWTLPGVANVFDADLGEVRLDRVPVGDHRWEGQIQAKGAIGGEEVQVGRVWLQPLDEGAFRLTAPVETSVGLAGYAARDEFNHSFGYLTGSALPVGGSWVGSGDTDAMEINGDGWAFRQTESDSAPRFEVAGTSAYTDICARVDVRTSGGSAGAMLGVLLHYVDVNNYVAARFHFPGGTPPGNVRLRRVVGGVQIDTADEGVYLPAAAADAWYTLQGLVTASGMAFLWIAPKGSALGDPTISMFLPELASGTLASGKTGLFDYNAGSGTPNQVREYDNFSAWVPVDDAVMFANQSCELRTDGVFRASADGAGWGKLTPEGDLLRLPPSGLEDRPVEVFLKNSRGDFDRLPDTDPDPMSARVYYRPSFLFPPG